jgi:hypothetical protein
MGITRVRIDLNNLRVAQVGVELAAKEIAEATRWTFNRANALTPVDEGNLRAGNQMTMRARRLSVTGTVENHVDYALAVHNGTKPHTIAARRQKALSFFWAKGGGVQVFVPRTRAGKKMGTGLRKGKNGRVALWIGKGYVRHPGTRARPWLDDALREMAALRGYKYTPGPGILSSRV